MNRSLPVVIIGVVLIGAIAAVWLFSRPPQPLPPAGPPPAQGSEAPGAQPPHVRGNANAPVTVEDFADFQCPTCGYYYTELKKIEGEFGDRLRVIFCQNPLVPMHQLGLVAAQ